MKEYLSLKEAAEIVGYSYQHFYHLVMRLAGMKVEGLMEYKRFFEDFFVDDVFFALSQPPP